MPQTQTPVIEDNQDPGQDQQEHCFVQYLQQAVGDVPPQNLPSFVGAAEGEGERTTELTANNFGYEFGRDGGMSGADNKSLVERRWENGDVNVATGQDESELVMAGMEGKVEMNTGNLNVPDEAAGELATTMVWPELTLAISGGKLDMEALFSWTAEVIARSEFSKVWATATTISLKIDVADIEEAAVTTTRAADNDGANKDVVKNRPANKLLKVECGWYMLKQNQQKKRQPAPQPRRKNPHNVTSR